MVEQVTTTQAVLGQISRGGGSSHLEKQMATIQVPSMRTPVFVNIERSLGNVLNDMVVEGLLSAGKEERQFAINNGLYHHRIYPAVTVVVDGGWSKRAHKHSYNVKSGGWCDLWYSHQETAVYWYQEQIFCSLCHL